MRRSDTIEDAATLALRALVWTLADPDRADRLLAVTGIDPDDLRERIGERPVLAASLGYLLNYEPDLIACAEELEVRPETLARAAEELDA